METNSQAQKSGRNQDDRFTLIEQWPERVGSQEWGKRVAKELSPQEFEAFLFHAEDEDSFRLWELYYLARAEKLRRQETLRSIVGAIDAGAWAISWMGVFGLVAWLYSPTTFEGGSSALWLYFHLVVMGIWGISLFARLPNALRDMLNDRNRDRSAENIARPMRYADDRINAVEFEGQKYRSSALLTKAMQESHERALYVRAGQEVLKKSTGRAFTLIFYVFLAILCIGLAGLFELNSSYVPGWLSILLTILGGVGLFFVARLRDRFT